MNHHLASLIANEPDPRRICTSTSGEKTAVQTEIAKGIGRCNSKVDVHRCQTDPNF